MEEPRLIKKNYKDILRQRKVLVMISLFVLIVLIAPSYALLSNFKKLDNAVNVTTANMNMSVTQSSSITLEGKLPESDASGLLNANPVSITVKNANTGPFTDTETTKFQNTSASTINIVKYELKLLPDTTQTTTLDSQYIKYAVSTDNGMTYSTPLKLSDSNAIIFTGYSLDLGSTKDLKLKIWVDEDAGSNGTNKNYYGSITVEMYQNINVTNLPKNNVMNYIANNDTIQFDSGIKYYKISGTDNGNGLYVLHGTENDNNPIYFYRGNVENNNVYFAGYCWKIVRTTETGGTKMIYNGQPDITTENGVNTYNCGVREVEWSTSTSTLSLNGTKNYGTGFTPNLDGSYTLTGVQSITVDSSTGATQIPTIVSNYPYTCGGNYSDNICPKLYKVDSYKESYNAYVYSSMAVNLLHSSSGFNSLYDSPAYVGYSLPESSKRYSYSNQSLSSSIYYGSSVDPTTYKLVDPVLELNDTHHYSYNSDDPNATGIDNDTGNVRYYYNKSSASGTSGIGRYIKFDKTKSISTILDEMLTESNSKNNPSTIQRVINTWWGSLDATFGSYLEDSRWCNDRSIGNYGGWSPNGTLYNSNWYDYSMVFNEKVRYDQSTYGSDANNIKNTNTPILTCSNPNDELSVTNGNLSYKLGLLTYAEEVMAGVVWYKNINSNKNNYLYATAEYWLLSPSDYGNYNNGSGCGIFRNGGIYSQGCNGYGGDYAFGVRPALSLASNTNIIRGDGSYTNPYVITE